MSQRIGVKKMAQEQGTVTSVRDDGWAQVVTDRKDACGDCGASHCCASFEDDEKTGKSGQDIDPDGSALEKRKILGSSFDFASHFKPRDAENTDFDSEFPSPIPATDKTIIVEYRLLLI